MIGVVYPNDSWILQKIGKAIAEIDGVAIGCQDITYWINWVYWEHFDLTKSIIDIVFFTHFNNGKRLHILDKADIIVCMSAHGKRELILAGIGESKIRVIPGFGLSVKSRKIRLGIAGRPYDSKRKGEDILLKLYSELNKNVFEFVFARDWQIGIGRVSDNFFNDIDYLLVTSTVEGGPMDVLNAKALNIPVISKDIGFIYSLKDGDDIIYEDDDVLIHKLKRLGHKISARKKLLSVHSWDNFKDWHKGMFDNLRGQIED